MDPGESFRVVSDCDEPPPNHAVAMPPHGHTPVLSAEVVWALFPKQSGDNSKAVEPPVGCSAGSRRVFVDCTLGRGGHSSLLACRLGPDDLLIGLDVDERNLAFSQERLTAARSAETSPIRCEIRLFHANFADVAEVLDVVGVREVDGVLADLGVSTNQLLDASYGLSFAADPDAPLDMRLDPRLLRTASDLLRTASERALADWLYRHADERASRRVARRIVQARAEGPILTTGRLAEIVRGCFPRPKPGDIDPATRTFMALRIEVNREFDALERLLHDVPPRLRVGGRLAIISFHSGEDGRVKRAFRADAAAGRLRVMTKKPLVPSAQEQTDNPRSRSAKLRVAERT